MLFNSYEFLFFFLPVSIAVFFALSAGQMARAAAAWLALVSIFFYGYWSPRYVLLLLASIGLNFLFGRLIIRARDRHAWVSSKRTLVLALAANLGALFYFKYANFFIDSINQVSGAGLGIERIVLPIGISFFTFTQIAYLVDVYLGKVREADPVHYTLFVTFFPHLIAGPVLHHAEMMPQFGRKQTYAFDIRNFTLGSTLLLLGLIKKVVLADGIQPFVGPVFEAESGYQLSVIEAWGGVLCYTLQLYFDFSGYSDMAIGLSKMINIDLPLNFNSPYKAANVSDFWRRWHMTLSRFLRDYLYIPLGGNRRGMVRRYGNLMTTMLLGGLWHGAGWTFVIWGGLHGLYLVVHQLWQGLRLRGAWGLLLRRIFGHSVVAAAITFFCVVVAWVFFRAATLDQALAILRGMFGMNGFAWPVGAQGTLDALGGALAGARFAHLEAFGGLRQWVWIAGLLMLAWFAPNSQQLAARFDAFLSSVRFQGLPWAMLGALSVCLFLIAAINGSHGASEFIYFNF